MPRGPSYKRVDVNAVSSPAGLSDFVFGALSQEKTRLQAGLFECTSILIDFHATSIPYGY